MKPKNFRTAYCIAIQMLDGTFPDKLKEIHIHDDGSKATIVAITTAGIHSLEVRSGFFNSNLEDFVTDLNTFIGEIQRDLDAQAYMEADKKRASDAASNANCASGPIEIEIIPDANPNDVEE